MKRILFVLTLGLNCLLSIAQGNSPTFENINPEGTISIGTIKTINEDQNGFIWICSNNGLFYYNSQEIIKQKFNTKVIDASMPIDANTMICDDANQLWVGTMNGLFSYNSSTNEWDWITFGKTDKSYTQLPINNLIQIDKSSYLLLSENNIFLFDAKENTLKPYHLKNNKSRGGITVINRLSDGSFIMGTTTGVVLTLANLEANAKQIYHAKQQAIKIICSDSLNYYVGYYDQGVDVLDKNGTKRFSYNTQNDGAYALPSNWIREIIKRDNGELWIATINGILIVNGEKRTIIKSSHYNRLPDNIINTLYKDSKGDMWIGTRNSGVGFFSDINYRFEHYKNINSEYAFTNSMVATFAESAEGEIWIGSENHGLSLFNQKTQMIRSDFSFLEKNKINSKSIIYQDDHKLWVGTFKNGIWKIDIEKETYKRYDIFKNGHSNPIINTIAIQDENIWCGTRGLGAIIQINSRTEKLVEHDLEHLDEANKGANWVWKIQVDKEDNVWACTENGLYRKSNDSDHFERIDTVLPEPYTKLTPKFISLYEANDGQLWLGTNGAGILIYSPKENTFEKFKDPQINNSQQIYSLLIDQSEAIWWASSDGIFQHNPNTGTTQAYTLEDGLSVGQYLPNAGFVSHNGQLYFGSSNGFSIITPQNIKVNHRQPKVYLSQLLINNKPYEEDTLAIANTKHLANLKNLELSYWQNTLSFRFATNNLIKPTKNSFRYRMINYEDNWSKTIKNRDITFTKVPPGNYTLEVLGSNNDGFWNATPLQVHIIISPPFWLSWYAYLGYSLLSLWILFLLYKNLKTKYHLKQEVIAAQYRNDANAMLFKEKQKFFMNISHEFRTPLTLILSPLQHLIDKHKHDIQSTDHLKLVQRNAKRLLRLTNQILDFNLIEAGKINSKFEQTDIIELCQSVFNYFEYQVLEKEITYSLHANFKSFTVLVDPDMIEKILFNLISNALKFSEEKGEVKITIDKRELSEDDEMKGPIAGEPFIGESLEIQVSDNGKGIDEQLMPKLFDRFTTATNQEESGSGIGLHMSAEYARINKAFIRINSTVGKGSTFTLNIPINQNLPREEAPLLLKIVTPETPLITVKTELPPSDQKTKRVILLAEDDTELRRYLKEILESRYKVVSAKNGQLAHEIAHEILPDLIVTDLSMPKMDGLELINALKNNDKSNQIPIIVLTAHNQSHYQMESIVQGANSFLTKPIDPDILIAQIENILKRRRIEEEKIEAAATSKTADSSPKDSVTIAQEIIEANFHNMQFGVDQLAQKMKQSRSTLHRIIKSKTNQNTSEFIRDIRLKKAIELLKENNMNIEEIAEMVGFNSISYFSRSFKKKYGITPSEYARSMKKERSV